MPKPLKTPLFSLALAALMLIGCGIGTPSLAAKKPAKSTSAKSAEAKTNAATPTPSKSELQDIASVKLMLQDLMDASNRHDLDAVLKHYSPNFTSGDSLSLKDVRGLIQDTWNMFPDIHYNSQTLEIRVNGNWAAVESLDTATATAKLDPTVSDKPGVMKSRSRGLLYLHRIGKTWEIVSDATLYEKATITYGPFDNINVDVEAPEQVFAGESYTAKIRVGIPAGNIAFATITQEPLTYPQQTGKDKFRTLSTEKTDLERIFKANTTNNNEVVTATVGFTEIGQDEQERPTINLRGIITVVKRVNVIPRSTYKESNSLQPVTRTSADGKIRVEATAPASPADDDEQPESEQAPVSPQD
jgi:ketosteroid isomerase-like protein